MTQSTTARPVGVQIQESSDDIRLLVSAIEQDNPSATITFLPGLVQISVPGQLIVRRETVESALGREWETHEFQLAIVSYFGHIKDWDDDQIVISWDH